MNDQRPPSVTLSASGWSLGDDWVPRQGVAAPAAAISSRRATT
jgi:hypothetical protein